MKDDVIGDQNELARLRSAVGGAMQAMMMIDRDFIITYVNQATRDLLKKHEVVMRTAYPGFEAENILGQCIDIFHKDPSHQRRLLSDPANLAHTTVIKIAELSFRLNVTAMIDDSGEYIGNALEWADITTELEKTSQAARLQGAVDASMQAIMMIDREFIITYANQSSLDLLRKYRQQMAAVFPGFDAEKIIGTCIDRFHKNPAHQRTMLSNPANLPYKTDIAIGELKFELNVTAIMDAAGDYVGNTLEWSDVTEVRKKEIEVTRLKSAIDGADTNLMICDSNLVITYANTAVVKMMAARADKIRETFPSFDAYNLVGQSIDSFHKDPSHQQRILRDPSKLPAHAEIKIAGLEFELNATAIMDERGKMMGNMVQWVDITEQNDAQRQIRNMLQDAVAGRLDGKIKVDQYEGFLCVLAETINELMHAIVEPLREAQRVVMEISQGNLTSKMQGEFEGEFAELRDSINSTTRVLANVVEQILDGSDSILVSSNEITRGNADLSQRTEEQASSLEQTASSMEQMTSTVKQNADNARTANDLASEACEQAEKGGEVVQQAVAAMGEINSSSKKIADIISVIDEIAFQTNLLALNAAVEAARAGEQGKGFAVVAAEVRNLAQRSAGAAKEIKALINDSVERVQQGSKLVNDSGETLQQIVKSVQKVSQIIAEIALAGKEQSSGIEEVNRAITQMDEMTQQNAALVEQAAAASESMNDEAKAMSELMEFFEIAVLKKKSHAVQQRVSHSMSMARRERMQPQRQRISKSFTHTKPKAEDDEWEEF